MTQTIYRFSVLIFCLFLFAGCGKSKEYIAVENQIKKVDEVKSRVTTLTNLGVNLDDASYEELIKFENEFEKNLKIHIVKVKKDEIILKLKQVEIMDFLGKARVHFSDFTVSRNEQIDYLRKLVQKVKARAKEKVLKFNSVEEINPELLFLELIGVEDLKTIEAWEKIVNTTIPDVFQ